MWPFLLRLGVVATIGVGLGIMIFLANQQLEAPHGRIPSEPNETNRNKVGKRKKGKQKSDEESQRQLLEDQLNNGTATCIICTDIVSRTHKVWPCPYCRNIFHLKCISRWAQSDNTDFFSCPICRKDIVICNYPLIYKCMCGRVTNPRSMDGVTPHCCGQLCRHKCGKRCHPGSCSDAD